MSSLRIGANDKIIVLNMEMHPSYLSFVKQSYIYHMHETKYLDFKRINNPRWFFPSILVYSSFLARIRASVLWCTFHIFMIMFL